MFLHQIIQITYPLITLTQKPSEGKRFVFNGSHFTNFTVTGFLEGLSDVGMAEGVLLGVREGVLEGTPEGLLTFQK